MKKALRFAGAAVGILVLAFAALASSFAMEGSLSARDQAARMEQLRAADDAPRASDDTRDYDDLPYDRLQVIATHNSYALRPTWLQTQVIGLVEPAEAPALQYDHQTLTEQLDAGIRSFELDVRWDGRGFTMVHVPLVANRATAIDFALGLDEIALWSALNTGHLPISIMVELKGDYMFLDPNLRPWDADAFAALDATVTDALGSRLFAPADRGDAGWPTVGDMRDRVLLFFGDNESARETYLALHPTGATLVAFTSSQTGAADAHFAVVDDPRGPLIRALTADGVIVRTRGDANLLTDPAERDAAFASGAQIVSTDFPPSEPQESTGYVAAFPGGVIVRAVP